MRKPVREEVLARVHALGARRRGGCLQPFAAIAQKVLGCMDGLPENLAPNAPLPREFELIAARRAATWTRLCLLVTLLCR